MLGGDGKLFQNPKSFCDGTLQIKQEDVVLLFFLNRTTESMWPFSFVSVGPLYETLRR